jgi:hypothetical protein
LLLSVAMLLLFAAAVTGQAAPAAPAAPPPV